MPVHIDGHPRPDAINVTGGLVLPPRPKRSGLHRCNTPDTEELALGSVFICNFCERRWSLLEKANGPQGQGTRLHSIIKPNGDWWVLVRGYKLGGIMQRWFGSR